VLNVLVGRLFSATHRKVPYLRAVRVKVQQDGQRGMVRTLGHGELFLQQSNGLEVLEADNATISALVHQYDRRPQVKDYVDRVYGTGR